MGATAIVLVAAVDSRVASGGRPVGDVPEVAVVMTGADPREKTGTETNDEGDGKVDRLTTGVVDTPEPVN